MKQHKEQAAVKVAPEKFTWMKYKGLKAKLLTHTKRNGDMVKTRLEPNDVFGYRTVKQRSTGKELVQIVLKSDGMDLAYNLAVRSFNTHVLKVSKPTVLPKKFKKPVDIKAIDKKAPAEPKVATKKITKVPESEHDRDEADAIFEHIEMDDSDIAWVKDQMRGAEYSLLGLARFCEYVYDSVGHNQPKMLEDLEGFFSVSSISGIKKGFVVDNQGTSLKDNFNKNYLDKGLPPIADKMPTSPNDKPKRKPAKIAPKKRVDRMSDVENFIRQFMNRHMGSKEVTITIDTNFSDHTKYSAIPGLKHSSVINFYRQLTEELKEEFGASPKIINTEIEEQSYSATIFRRTLMLNNTEFDLRARVYKTGRTKGKDNLTFVEYIFET